MMEFQEEFSKGLQIEAINEQGIRINNKIYAESILLTAELIESCEQLKKLHDVATIHARIKAINPEVVLIGCGAIQIYPEPAFYQFFVENRIGVEIMTTAAAARTYNILQAEGRRVLAVLILA
jgi:uncharacterized protein